MNKYSYCGPVMRFNVCVANNFQAETIAESEAKARNNICFQFKSKYGYGARTTFTLPGELVLEEEMAEEYE